MKKFFITMFRFIGALIALARGLMMIGMIFTGALAVYLCYVVAQVTIDQYNTTLTWENTAYETPLAEIEPSLIANIMDGDIVDAAAALEALYDYVENLDGRSIPDRATAQSILDEAGKWQEVYGLRSDAISRLSLYLELEDAISEAYATLDTERLEQLSVSLYTLEMRESTESGRQYMERLRQVSSDFEELEALMTEVVPTVGTVEDGVWTILHTCTRTELSDVLTKVQAMQKFPALRDVTDLLYNVADVLNYNKNARDYFAYKEFESSVKGITRRSYIPVSSIYTYGQALEYGCNIQVEEMEGFTVSLDSKVYGLYHNGERLESSQYVRWGTYLTAVIEPVYEPIPDYEPIPEDVWQDEYQTGEEYYEW